MNMRMKVFAALLAGGVVCATGAAVAQSTYGYNSGATGPVAATAKVNVNVSVPLLVLLKVGTAGSTIDTLTLTATATGMTTNGDSQAVSWNGSEPVFTSTPSSLGVAAWTNSGSNATLTCAATTPFAPGAPVISVASTAGVLNHPGTNTTCGSSVTVVPNTVTQDTWTYSMTSAAMAAAKAGSYSQTVTYTITAL